MSLRPYVHLDQPLAGAGSGDQVPLDRAARHHLTTVLRLAPGAPLEVADGRGATACAVLADDTVELTTDAQVCEPRLPRLELAQALAKGRKLDEVVRQATELGVDALHPVTAERSVVRLDGDRREKARERWRSVARSAAEQSRRPSRPWIAPVRSVAELDPSDALVLVAEPGAPALPRTLERAAPAQRVVLVVGPEGGWTAGERGTLLEGGATAVGLGPTVLRAEHAGAAGLAVLAALLGRWET